MGMLYGKAYLMFRSSKETRLILVGWIWIWIQGGKYDEEMCCFEMLDALISRLEASSVVFRIWIHKIRIRIQVFFRIRVLIQIFGRIRIQVIAKSGSRPIFFATTIVQNKTMEFHRLYTVHLLKPLQRTFRLF
jgi:hypothetical protein